MKECHIITSLDQAALIADAFKLSILEQLVEEPRTARQIAQRLDIKQTRLYRHIDALLKAGLIEVVKSEQKRGTVERHFQSVAQRFEMDSRLFGGSDNRENPVIGMVQEMLREAEQDIIALADSGVKQPPDYKEGLAMRLSVQGTKQEIAELQKKLKACIAEHESILDKSAKNDPPTYRGLLLLYPVLPDEAVKKSRQFE